ncbi:MAG: hypothetical protein ACI9G1_003535 [Pirellulaceae bacterium]|jgi:hypothetical protein
MAKRVPVVVSQSQFSDANRRNLEEELVAVLLMDDNVEVTVIPHLNTLEDGSTGLLCLEGLNGDLILCTWDPPGTAVRQLIDLGQPAVQGRTSYTKNDELVGDGGRRLVYAIDLSEQSSADAIRSEVLRIRDESQTKVFNIVGMSLPIAPPRPQTQTAAKTSNPVDTSGATTSGATESTTGNSEPVGRPAVAADSATSNATSSATSTDAEIDADPQGAAEKDTDDLDRELDQLLDDFDAMDI